MLKFNNEIRYLVQLKQKFLALLSRECGLHSARVESQVLSWLCNLEMRVFAIETVYRSRGSKTPGVDGIVLGKENLHYYLNILREDNLLKYKSSGTRRVFIPKGEGTDLRPLGIPTIEDRIVQTLFVQAIEPIIDPHADVYSFGFRKGRNAHQAIGELSRILNVTPYLRRKKLGIRRYFSHTKHIIKIDVKGFFDNVDHQYLLNNYPIPKKFKNVLQG
jgi:RNA-directed DNA polymerase